MPLPTFKQDSQPQSGHLLNIVKGIGQLLGKDKLRENPNAPASDWRTRKSTDPVTYKEDWWDSLYGNRGQAVNKSIQMDALARKNALDEDTELRSRNIGDDAIKRDWNREDATTAYGRQENSAIAQHGRQEESAVARNARERAAAGQDRNWNREDTKSERSWSLEADEKRRTRDIEDIRPRILTTNTANNAVALANIQAGKEQEDFTNTSGSSVAKGTLGNTLLGLKSTAQKIGNALAQDELAGQKARLDKTSFNPVQYIDMAGARQDAELNKAMADKFGSSTAKTTSEAVDSATTMGADSIARNALTGIQAADQMGLSALDRAKAQNAFTKSDEFAPLQAGALRSSLLSPTAAYENTLSETDRNKASVNAMREGTELERQKLNEQLYPLPVGTALVNKAGRGYEQRDNKIKAFNAAPRPVGALTPEEIQARLRKQGTDAATGMQSNGKGGWR